MLWRGRWFRWRGRVVLNGRRQGRWQDWGGHRRASIEFSCTASKFLAVRQFNGNGSKRIDRGPLALRLNVRTLSLMNETTRFETRAVLAARYVKLDKCLTHVVETDESGFETRVLCRKVRLDSVCDAGGSNPDAPATCTVCAKRDPRVR
jgi:hypothetical protein